jgi:hypothetical protein
MPAAVGASPAEIRTERIGIMGLSNWIWLATAAYGLHILEEFVLDWRNWARAVIGLPVEWSDFYIVNALVIVLGIVAANLATAAPGWRLPTLPCC